LRGLESKILGLDDQTGTGRKRQDEAPFPESGSRAKGKKSKREDAVAIQTRGGCYLLKL